MSDVTLYVFDVDDTLILSQARIRARRGLDKQEMTTQEYRDKKNTGTLDGYEMDFSDFSNPIKIQQTIEASEPGPALKHFERMLHRAEIDDSIDIGILTARSNEQHLIPALRAWMKARAIPFDTLNPNLVFATNSPRWGLQGMTPSEQKLSIIRELLDIYDRVVLIDDDPAHKELIDASDVSDRISVELV
jgi:hypothetical protein